MTFNSLDFFIFFPTIVLLYFAAPARFKNIFLLSGCYYFYASWNLIYILLLIIATLTGYFAGIQISRSKKKLRKTTVLLIALAVNISALFIFKYFNFFNDSIKGIFYYLGVSYNLPNNTYLLPIGISFYTLKVLSYLLDIYHKEQKPEKSYVKYALYVSFFPQLLAGPIERAKNLIPQFNKIHAFNYQNVTTGLKIMAWGYFQKLVIADRLAVVVNKVYDDPTSSPVSLLILATVFFAFQIYCDFAGYSNISIGAARILGFTSIKNFDRPYFSKSIAEFWKRWHISLSSWLRDYIYIPLGGSRVGKKRWRRNIFLTFLISGLWHGANWTFIVWGSLQGLFIIASDLISSSVKFSFINNNHVFLKITRILLTFSLSCFAWVFFRAKNLNEAFYIAGTILWTPIKGVSISIDQLTQLGLSSGGMIVSFLVIVIVLFVDILERKQSLWGIVASKPLWFRWSVYYTLIFSILILGIFNKSKFIYFQF